MKDVNQIVTTIHGSQCNIADLTDEEYEDLYAQIKAQVDYIKNLKTQDDLKKTKEKPSKPETQEFSYNDIDFDTTPTEEEMKAFKDELW